jgi:hypothetical protein
MTTDEVSNIYTRKVFGKRRRRQRKVAKNKAKILRCRQRTSNELDTSKEVSSLRVAAILQTARQSEPKASESAVENFSLVLSGGLPDSNCKLHNLRWDGQLTEWFVVGTEGKASKYP